MKSPDKTITPWAEFMNCLWPFVYFKKEPWKQTLHGFFYLQGIKKKTK
jgi:hypothetical protein